MGSSKKSRHIQDQATQTQFKMGKEIENVSKGIQKTAAQLAFERGVQDAQAAQQATAVSGFGGNVGGRLRGLNEAQANLGVEANVARQLLQEEEVARLRQNQSQFRKAEAGLQADRIGYESALLSGGAQAGASLIDAFGSRPREDDKKKARVF